MGVYSRTSPQGGSPQPCLYIHRSGSSLSHSEGEGAGHTDRGTAMTCYSDAVKNQTADKHEMTQENIHHILSKKKKKAFYKIGIYHPNFLHKTKQGHLSGSVG